MCEILIVLRKELRQQLRDRRALILLFVPALLGPALCLVLLVSHGSSSEPDAQRMSVWSHNSTLNNSQTLKNINDRLNAPPFAQTDSHNWDIKWSVSPWDDLVRVKSDLALIQEEGEGWKLVPSPMSLNAAALTTETVVALNGAELPGDRLAAPISSAPPNQASSAIPVANFFNLPAANRGIASYLLPVLLLSLFTLAGSSVAIECIAAEKEHGTFDSLRVSGAPGAKIVMGKLLAVVLTSAISGSLTLSLFIGVGMIRPRGTWNLGLDYVTEAGINLATGAVLALLTASALVLCSAMLLFVSGIAKTIKETQYWVSLVAFVPVSLGGASVIASGDILTRIFEILPFSNVAIGMSESIAGAYNVRSLAECLIVNFCTTLLLISLSVRMLFGVGSRKEANSGTGCDFHGSNPLVVELL